MDFPSGNGVVWGRRGQQLKCIIIIIIIACGTSSARAITDAKAHLDPPSVDRYATAESRPLGLALACETKTVFPQFRSEWLDTPHLCFTTFKRRI